MLCYQEIKNRHLKKGNHSVYRRISIVPLKSLTRSVRVAAADS
jgi:hypothetical protein